MEGGSWVTLIYSAAVPRRDPLRCWGKVGSRRIVTRKGRAGQSTELGCPLQHMWTVSIYSVLQMLSIGSDFDSPFGKSHLWRKPTSSWQNNPEICNFIWWSVVHLYHKCDTHPERCSKLSSYQASELPSLIITLKLWQSKWSKYFVMSSGLYTHLIVNFQTWTDWSTRLLMGISILSIAIIFQPSVIPWGHLQLQKHLCLIGVNWGDWHW